MYGETVFFKEQALSKAALTAGHSVFLCAMHYALHWDAKAVLQPHSPEITGPLLLRESCVPWAG